MNALDRVPEGTNPAVARVVDQLAGVAADLAARIARGGIDENLGEAAGTNTDGDAQKALDVIADEAFMAALREGGDVRHYASEEQDSVVEMSRDGTLAVAIDPLDGSSNINCNVSIGTIFGIYPAASEPNASFLRPGRELLASGYAIYGPQCMLIVTMGEGTLRYVLDPSEGRFRFMGAVSPIPDDSREYAINSSNYRHWTQPIRAFIDDCVAGEDGPAGVNYNMRWIASLVADTHRILARGGMFLYPGDSRKGYARGRLRYVYECAPIAMLVEQAGGRATDGEHAILDITPDTLHARTPLVFGSTNNVVRVATYHDLPESEISALFGTRGLFRA